MQRPADDRLLEALTAMAPGEATPETPHAAGLSDALLHAAGELQGAPGLTDRLLRLLDDDRSR